MNRVTTNRRQPVKPVQAAVDGAQLIRRSGLDTPNPAGRTTDWIPQDFFTFMIFNTPFEAETNGGRASGRAGQMLVTPPGRRQWHRGLDGAAFSNDWIQVDAGLTGPSIRQAGFPIYEIFNVSDPRFVERIVSDIQREQLLNAPKWEEVIACRVTELILLTRRYHQIALRMEASPAEHVHYERFCSIRQRVRSECTKPWSVKRMAGLAHLSPNRFAVLYRKFFRVSPIDDVINMRIDEAKQLLTSGNFTASEIADRCGFNNLNYFSRLFKKRTGRSPKQYRA